MVTAIRPGVLALQGAVEPHLCAFRDLGYEPTEVRTRRQLDDITHLVLPGGESTTLHNLLERSGLWQPLYKRLADGQLAAFGTCAGAILLGHCAEQWPPRLGVVDIEVQRNAYGRQLDSFIGDITFMDAGNFKVNSPMRGVFIRAPRFGAMGDQVRVLGCHVGEVVLVQEGRHLLAAFHPELTADRQLHQYFLGL